MAARTLRPAFLQVTDNRLANFVLNRILLDSTALRPPNGKSLVAPIEVGQSKLRYLAAAQTVNSKQQKGGLSAKIARS